ncbi:MAG: D-glycero-alpha-D-manno-heptose-1,7-bisphosphate 7-phosphatase [Janthinobacterium lividum]
MSTPAARLRPALFLDRDGVINVDTGFVYRPQDCILIEGIAPLVRTANQLGYFTCVVTNQSGIGRGLYTEQDFHSFMHHMRQELGVLGARIDAVYFCPFHPEHGVGVYRRESECRKPAPGMLRLAAQEHRLDLRRSAMVGDRCSDLVAGEAAGVQTLFLFSTAEKNSCHVTIPYNRVNRLSLVQQHLLTTSVASSG